MYPASSNPDGPAIFTRQSDVPVGDVSSPNAVLAKAAAAGPMPTILPPVDWAAIGQTAPVPIVLGTRRPADPLPHADIVILTWTSAEWFALNHIFLGSDKPADIASKDYLWRDSWLQYSRGVGSYTADAKSGKLWGTFCMVRITDRSGRPWRVLLFKSSSHLAHPPWIEGLAEMMRCILTDTKADRVYTIGTAGGARLNQRLGDSVVTNAAMLDIIRPQNAADPDNGNMYRCPTWFPSSALFKEVENKLLFKLSEVVTPASLAVLFKQLQDKHAGDPAMEPLQLDDLLNEALRPEELSKPKIEVLKDVPLLTTDFYYIAVGDHADAYSFLEMDDAIVGREANKLGVRFACIRNISDPVVPARSHKGEPISDTIRADWSGLIYTSCGLFTSYNGALATWAAIAGEGTGVYNPARDTSPVREDDPIEVKLAFNVMACGTCDFFWPGDVKTQPYGPYASYDFDVNVPYAAAPGKGSGPQPWVRGRTAPSVFPNAAVAGGCRKAPIMTIGINPNMTAFSPGQTGAAWAYPNFTSDNGTDAWTKYAWYYRYRTVSQERFDFEFSKQFILPEGQVIAARSGHIVSTERLTSSPAWSVTVRYDGDPADTRIDLPGTPGDFPYMLLNNIYAPGNTFAPGDVIAGRLAVPQGVQVDVRQQQQGYYMQFVPVLQQFQKAIRDSGVKDAELRMGEDVSQLDMIACASPHWNKGFLGGSDASIAAIVDNCVTKNAWAIKQMVQSRPAVLYIVSVSSWHMFYNAFGAHVQRDVPLPDHPADNDFTLLRETTDPAHPAYINFDVTVDGQRYQHKVRLVITPHFSYNTNFQPQYRMPKADWESLLSAQPGFKAALDAHPEYFSVPLPKYKDGYIALMLPGDPATAKLAMDILRESTVAWEALQPRFYDPHALMASVLDEMYKDGTLTWKEVEKKNGKEVEKFGYLARTEGSCRFCSNRHWRLPNECRYDKTKEEPPAPGWLEKVADAIIAAGKPAPVAVKVVEPQPQEGKSQEPLPAAKLAGIKLCDIPSPDLAPTA